MTTNPKPRKRLSRSTKVASAAVGALLVGTATFAALSWYTSRGTTTSSAVQATLTLTSAVSTDADGPTPEVTWDGTSAGVLSPGTGEHAVSVTNGAAGIFSLSTTNVYPGYNARPTLTYEIKPSGVPMKLQRIEVVPTGAQLGATWAPGTQPAIAWLTAADCGKEVDDDALTAGIPSSFELTPHIMTTTATPAAPATAAFDVLVQWVPSTQYVPGSCNSTPPASTVAP